MYQIIWIIIVLMSSSSIYAHDKYMHFYNTYTVKYDTGARDRVISVGLNLIDIPQISNLEPSNSVYNQILSSSETKPFGDEHGRSTNAHETVHGINNVLRNKYKKILKKNVNAFYAGARKGIIIENPKLTMRDIIPFIPEAVRGYRFNLYFVEQLGSWNDVPTYPMDEWSAYIAGAECAVDDYRRGLKAEKSDCVSGALEFSIYCTALSMAIKNRDSDFWKNNTQFKHTMKYYLIKSEKIFFEGQSTFPSDKQDKLLWTLREHNDTADMRQFLLNEFDGIFVD
jgi:hypothetical protein